MLFSDDFAPLSGFVAQESAELLGRCAAGLDGLGIEEGPNLGRLQGAPDLGVQAGDDGGGGAGRRQQAYPRPGLEVGIELTGGIGIASIKRVLRKNSLMNVGVPRS